MINIKYIYMTKQNLIRQKKHKEQKENYVLEKGITEQEDYNHYKVICTLKYSCKIHHTTLRELQEEIDDLSIVVEYFNILVSESNRSCK